MVSEPTRSRLLWLPFLAAGSIVLLLRPSPEASPNAHLLATILGGYLLIWSAALALSRGKGGKMVKKFLLTSTALAVAVGVLETLAAAGMVDFRRLFETNTGDLWAHPGNVPDSRLFYLRKPHSIVDWEGVRYRYDRHGFRNSSELTAADVVVTGDSFVEGWNVPAEELVTARLASRLGLRVMNLGQSGYGPQQELETFRRFGLPLSPRACVWVFFEGNDLGDVARYEWLRKNWKTLSHPTLRERSFVRNALAALRKRLERDESIPFLKEPGEAARAAHRHRSGVCRGSQGRSERLYFWYPSHRLSAQDEAALQQVGRDLGEAARLCRKREIELLVVFAPTKHRVYRDLCTFAQDEAPGKWVGNDLPRRLETLLAQVAPGVGYLDLTPALRAEAAAGRRVYFDYDTHWTAAGHAVAAREIAGLLTRGKS